MPRRLLLLPLLLLLVGLAACHRAPKTEVWKLELMTNPTTPMAGQATLVRVLLMNSSGAALDGGIARVDFALPARTGPPVHLTLAPVGNGIYQGHVTLPYAGSWTITLVMARQGRSEIQRYPLTVLPAA